MTPEGSPQFSSEHAKTVYEAEEPELYKLAEDALFNGDGTFTHGGRLWEVGEGKPSQYLVIRPEVRR
jgi:hypothetical protein